MTTPHDLTENVAEVEPESIEMTKEAIDEGGGHEVASGEVHPRLIVKRAGAETDIEFGFSCPAVIGRFDPSVGPIDVDLGELEEGSYVSRKHAKITEAEGVFSIHDLGSSNGIYILRGDDFERVTDAELADGDEIALGNARFVFRLN
ncbi:hypothetical protein C0431_04700 [bacterium]|nr:hypothetical protein [bacterium]